MWISDRNPARAFSIGIGCSDIHGDTLCQSLESHCTPSRNVLGHFFDSQGQERDRQPLFFGDIPLFDQHLFGICRCCDFQLSLSSNN